jgi:hypothetical protein
MGRLTPTLTLRCGQAADCLAVLLLVFACFLTRIHTHHPLQAAFDPLTFTSARFCEARVWNLLNPACAGCLDGHLDYAQGNNLSNPMPLFVRAARPLALPDVVTLMRTHFEGTWFDNTGVSRPDVGAGAGNSPYRARPLSWEWNGDSYLNERTVGVQQSGWAFIAQVGGGYSYRKVKVGH